MRNVLLLYPALWLFLVSGLQAQIPVLPGGTGLLTFDTLPAAAEWSTAFASGYDAALTTAEQLDASVVTNDVAIISNALTATTPITDSSKYSSARWNSAHLYLQMRPTGNAYSMLMATLQNQTGADVPYLEVSYDFTAVSFPSSVITEDIPGWRAFYSLSGQPGSWTFVPEFSVGDSGSLTVVLELGSWPPDDKLYLLWADDNGPSGDSPTALNIEGLYTLDNFSAIPLSVPPLKVAISPEAQYVPQCATVTISTAVQGGTAPYTYEWFKDNTNAPLSGVTVPTLTLASVQPADSGTYFVRVTDSTSGGAQVVLSSGSIVNVTPDPGPPALLSATSSTDLHTIKAVFNKPVIVASPVGDDFLLEPVGQGTNISFTNATVVNGSELWLSTASPLPPQNFNLLIQTEGVHDICGAFIPSGTATGLVQQLFLAAIDASNTWKYFFPGMEPPSNWIEAGFDDSSSDWTVGNAVFDGYALDPSGRNTVGGQTVRTQLPLTNSFYPALDAVIPSYCFRRHFNLPANPGDVSLRLRSFFDDYAIVYLNGQEAWRDAAILDPNPPFADYVLQGNPVLTAGLSPEIDFPATNLVNGDNVLAVYLKQFDPGSPDMTMALELVASVTNFVSASVPTTLTITANGDGTVTISWNPAGGTLQESSNLVDWFPSTNQANGLPRDTLEARYFRVR